MTETPIALDFLRDFTRRLIASMHFEATMNAIAQEKPEEKKVIVITKNEEKQPEKKEIESTNQKLNLGFYPSKGLEIIPGDKKLKLVEMEGPSQAWSMQKPMQFSAPEIKKKLPELKLGKIDLLVNDQYVQEIECAGPSRPLIIMKDGGIETSPISLTEEEITSCIKEFARLSGKEIVNDILRAEYQGYEIVALISEFVGSRFILRK